MDISTLAIITGIGSSLFTQAIKRQGAGTLENIGLASGLAVTGTFLSSALGQPVDIAQATVVSFAFHGITSDQLPMKMLQFHAIDKLMGGIGKAFASVDSTGSTVKTLLADMDKSDKDK